MNEYDEKPIWTALHDLNKRIDNLEQAHKNQALATMADTIKMGDAFKHDMGIVVKSLKGLLELSLSLRDSEREMLGVLKSLANQDQKQLDIINDLSERMETYERHVPENPDTVLTNESALSFKSHTNNLDNDDDR